MKTCDNYEGTEHVAYFGRLILKLEKSVVIYGYLLFYYS